MPLSTDLSWFIRAFDRAAGRGTCHPVLKGGSRQEMRGGLNRTDRFTGVWQIGPMREALSLRGGKESKKKAECISLYPLFRPGVFFGE